MPGSGAKWTTLPGYFKAAGYYASSSGKVFHPNFPADFDRERSAIFRPLMYPNAPPHVRALKFTGTPPLLAICGSILTGCL